MSAQQAYPLPQSTGEDATIIRLRAMDFEGDEMIGDLQRDPVIRFGRYTFNFNSDVWDFRTDDSPASSSPLMKARFDMSTGKATWKLFVLCSLFWSGVKVGTVIGRYKNAKRSFFGCGAHDARWSEIEPDGYDEYLRRLAGGSASTRRTHLRPLMDFLVFRREFFRVPIDPWVADRLQADAKTDISECFVVRCPPIDDEYLDALVRTCEKVIDEGTASHRDGIYAAIILLASQVGMRASEALGLESNSILVSRVEGREDIAYLKFKVFKNSAEDGGHKPAVSFMTPRALKAYLFLDEACRKDRERLGVKTLVVLPRQKRVFANLASLERGVKKFVLSRHEDIPCLDTQDRFPDMPSTNAGRFAKSNGIRVEPFGLTGDETFVYPRFHSFRVTVATKMYQAGVGLRWVQKHMNHLSEDMTASYIKSDRESNREMAEAVYRAVLIDKAELIGKFGKKHTAMMERLIDGLPEKVKEDDEAIIRAAAERCPTRKKLGGFCIKCGRREPPCGKAQAEKTDKIYCQFGLCPYEHTVYFFAGQCLDMVRSHMRMVEESARRGWEKAAKSELHKARNVIRGSLVPELDSLEQQVGMHGRSHIVDLHPELADIIDGMPAIREEIGEWLSMSI